MKGTLLLAGVAVVAVAVAVMGWYIILSGALK